MTKPYKLDNLKKFTRHEVWLTRALYELLPATDVREKVHVAIRKALMKHLGQDIRYYVSSVEKKGYNDFVNALPSLSVMVILGLTPLEKKAFVQIDPNIADLVINKLLGSTEAALGEISALTETEQGVLQYLIMQVLMQIYTLAGAEPRVHFRFEKFVFDPVEVTKYASSKDSFCIITMEVSLFNQAGFVRLIFPYGFLEGLAALPRGAGDTKGERRYFARQLLKWGFMKTSLWGEAGNAFLSPLEMKDLEAGDVVLFDETGLKLSGKKPAGEIFVRFGAAEGGMISTVVDADQKMIICRIGEVVKGANI